jgi:hypothetical protein
MILLQEAEFIIFFLLLLDISVCNIVIIKVLSDHYIHVVSASRTASARVLRTPVSRTMQHQQERAGQEAAAWLLLGAI